MKISIKPHSAIDIITNSSTEVFVCDREKGLEETKAILVELLDMFNKHSGYYRAFYDVFKEPYIKPSETIYHFGGVKTIIEEGDEIIIEGATDQSIPFCLLEYIETVFYVKNRYKY